MPIFKYKGYAADGSAVSGVIEASGFNDALLKVKSGSVFVSEMKDSGSDAKKSILPASNSVFLCNATRQLSILLSAGVPLMEALQSLSSENKGYYKNILIKIKDRISEGAALYKSFDDFRNIFPEFYISMVKAGEEGGKLDKVLMKLSDFLEMQENTKAKIRTAMIYPLIMAGVSMVVLSFLFTFVIPKIVKIFQDTKSALPFITKALIFISNIFVNYWWIIIVLLSCSILLIKNFVKRHRAFVDGMLLRLPGGIIQSLYYARFARTLSFLTEGGVPLLNALKLSSGATGNSAINAAVIKAEELIASGQRLSASLEGFPPVFLQLIATGEKSGRLADVLNKAADSYEGDFSRKINRAVSLFEPVMIFFMGLLVGFIVLAILLPMFQLNQLIK